MVVRRFPRYCVEHGTPKLKSADFAYVTSRGSVGGLAGEAG